MEIKLGWGFKSGLFQAETCGSILDISSDQAKGLNITVF